MNKKKFNMADFWKIAKRLSRYLRPQRLRLTIVIICSIIAAVSAVVSPKISGLAVNQLAESVIGKTTVHFDVIGRLLMVMFFIYFLSDIFTFIMQFMMVSISQKVVYQLRQDVNRKLAKLPLRYFDAHQKGDILSRMTNDVDTISTTLQQSLIQIIQSIFQLIGFIVMMLTISPLLTLIIIGTLPLYLLATGAIAKRSQDYFAAQQQIIGKLSSHTSEMYAGHKVVKAFGHEDESIAQFETMNQELNTANWKAQFVSGMTSPVMNFITNIGYVLICVVGGIFATRSWMGIGDITAFIQYSRQLSQPIIQVAGILNIMQSTTACAERVFEVLDAKEETPDPKDTKAIVKPHGNIQFEHVKFRYNESKPLIEDMNLDINEGETIAIVGPTGAGKTTLVNLLMRFYEINSGKIKFDGVDLREIRRGDLRTMFGMVLQDTWLFQGSIEENIKYGRENATHDEIVNAARAAYADHFIRNLPEGYKTIINEEASNISQGEKQLLTIARAMLANPTVLILDEATSSVDTRTEMLIRKAMGTLMRGHTNFVIAHRLSTIRDAKCILVMNHGSIIEQGNHKELLAKGGFYAELYNAQFSGEST
ncbi:MULTISPECIES: ABC transporter ATP-binding protein [Clostridium]|uniref:Putative ABC transporter ATP-binding protein n=1 Tax=Clostridium ragsdalei P11 TaxID=1353534 RepID=A0A1A6AVV5_9CLOT|nr:MULTISPECIES: ABC transporter ATP-binding protein [Clostridium]OBR94168.1 putative ABC transporter ATP-binding protein [Clostridium ragsdalei P11]QXE20941.1 ABC transporter [Clostridium sp. 001]